MQGTWAAFAKDPKEGLSNIGWPIYKESGKPNIQLRETVQVSRADK
jgi:hypothetical protein